MHSGSAGTVSRSGRFVKSVEIQKGIGVQVQEDSRMLGSGDGFR